MSAPFDIQVKLTSELTAAERTRMCRLFGAVFQRPFPEDLFLRKYRDAWSGNSFHCLAVGNEIAAAFSAVLFRYSFFGKEHVFASAIDLMLESQYRPNVGLIKCMSDSLYRRLSDVGVSFVFSCVREEMMRFHQVVGAWRNIGRLSYYVAPVGGPRVPGAGAVMRWLVGRFNALPGRTRDPAMSALPIGKVNDEAFRHYRYSFFPTEYRQVKVDGGEAMYTGKMFWALPGAPPGVRLSLLVDVQPPRPDVFGQVISAIVRTDRDTDYLIYPGHLSFQPRLLWRVPRRMEPARYYLGGRILRPDLIDDRVYQIANWDINLSNTDLV